MIEIADAFRIPGHMIGVTPRTWETEATTGYNSYDKRTGGKADAVERRRFIGASTGAGLAAALPEMKEISAPGQRIGRRTPDELRRRAARLRRLDEILGGGDTYRVYLAEYLSTKRLVKEGIADSETHLSMLSVLAEQAQQAGWAAFDAGKQADAFSLYKASLNAATEAGDNSLAGNALAFLAYQRIDENPQTGLSTAIEACQTAGPQAPQGVRALLNERLAWSYARAGMSKETEKSLHVAEAALGEVSQNPQLEWTSWVDSTELQIMSGRCWTVLDRPLRAVPVLESALSQYDDTQARDKSLYLSWLAESYISAREVEQAALVVGKALELSSGVASVRPRKRLRDVVHKLQAHSDIPEVAEIMERSRVQLT
ncbi:XRE family transcriptional regulator [Streptomyces albipurpureus]|uniref:XRE family transcriptional regulator n=1 Tax=Streptomyces albipurpureus TaxID=2897419 RepID=A0ABT0UK06_9ACTN|nr:XRE family transcriptional regulator [Streptomyces sp. CWNU-1]MCM2388972.1 XRE family transcriptional regulator [Streptomyces sp. CWNU-1]